MRTRIVLFLFGITLTASVALAVVITIIVTDDGGDSGNGPASQEAEWVECMLALSSDPDFFPNEELLTFSVREAYLEACDPSGDGLTQLWITCTSEEFDKLNPEVAETVEGSIIIAANCREELESPDPRAEWVDCIVALDADPSFTPEHELIDRTVVTGYRSKCPEGEGLTDLWVTCINEEVGKGHPELPVTVDESFDIAERCGARLENPDPTAEWVSCIVQLDADPTFFPDEEFVTFEIRERYMEECDPTGEGLTNLWITCINQELAKNPDVALTVGEAFDIAQTCGEQVAEPGGLYVVKVRRD